MNKIILKTALKTLLALIIIFAVVFGALSIGYPSGMADFFEKSGNYSFAAGYASLNYSYTGKTEDLARCVNDYIMAENDRNIIHFGGRLIEANGFDELCESESDRLGLDYRQFVYGSIACSKYRQNDSAGAIAAAEAAFTENGGFPVNNALVRLTVLAEKDYETLVKIRTSVGKISPGEDEREYYDSVIKVLDKLID